MKKTKRFRAKAMGIMLLPAIILTAGQMSVTAYAETFEWATDDGSYEEIVTTPAELPASLDLRDKGWVTPVKQQGPWQTCWAFGATAAAESSILSDANLTYDKTGLDLSERHLAWYAVHHVSEAEDPAQAGEGGYPLEDGNKAFDTGGANILVTTMFSQGVGPVTEEEFPYRGVDGNGISHRKTPAYPYSEFEKDPDLGTLRVFSELYGNIGIEATEKVLREAAVKEEKTYEEELEIAKNYAIMLYKSTEYSKTDDWSIPSTDGNGAANRFKHAGLMIKDGNVLPAYWNTDSTAINTLSMTAIKRELAKGRGVSIGYKADLAQPGALSDNTYMNRDKWAQYTFDPVGIDHAVCLVGWDDDYPAANFTHNVYLKDAKGNPVTDESGNPVIDPDSDEKTTPPGNGAWIVKNSWGSETDMVNDDLGNPTGGGEYGMRNSEGKATGYFYLSYYDKTISNPETMSFSSSLLGPTGIVSIFQHDYMAAMGGFYTEPSESVMSSANVFDLREEDGDQVVVSVGGRTSDQNQRATFAIYRLNDGATDPTDGKLLSRISGSFEYAGYHRMDLEQPLAIRAGYKYSIVSTVSSQGENGEQTYSVSANQGVSKVFRDWQHTLPNFRNSNLVWNRAVVNKGESFLYKDGKWVDWSDYIAKLPVPDDPDVKEAEQAGVKFDRYIDALPIDNFSVKIYAEPATITLTHQEAKDPACTEPGNTPYWYYDAIEATDTSEGLYLYFNDKYGKEPIELADTVIPALGHKWGDWTKLDEMRHQRICENDHSHTETAEHDWDEGRITKETTEKEEGTKTYTCTVCKASKTESIPKPVPQESDNTAKTDTTPKDIKKTAGNSSALTKSVNTGDKNNAGVWITLLAASVSGIAATAFLLRRRKN